MGWNTESIDGHDFEQINASLIKEQNSDKPYLIAGSDQTFFTIYFIKKKKMILLNLHSEQVDSKTIMV